MSKVQRCPDCRQWLDSDECYCGWKSVTANTGDHRCIFQHSGKRCPYPGTISPSTHASSTWYCLGHYQNKDDQKKCIEILLDAEKNFIAVIEERIHWTVKLIPEIFNKAKQNIQNLFFKLFGK